MDVVRSADMNKTPDIRTRAFLPRWGAEIDIAFVISALSVHSIISLLANAGIIVGIGDFRQGKGKGSFGTFAVAGDDLGDWPTSGRPLRPRAEWCSLPPSRRPKLRMRRRRSFLAILQAERARRAA